MDFFREPFGEWDLATGRRSTRRLLVLVYGYAWQVVDVMGVAKTFVRSFAMGRIGLDEFTARVGKTVYEVRDTPLYVVSNGDRSKYLVWSDVKDTQTLRERLTRAQSGEFDAEMAFPMEGFIPEFWRLSVWTAAVPPIILCGVVWWSRRRTRKIE
jgi:hypothetical protein